MAFPFRQPPETNYRAVRNMGLAAWWGSSLLNLAGVVPAVNAQGDKLTGLRIQDKILKSSRGMQAAAVGSYLVGVGLVRFDGSPLSSNGIPRWITEGVESKLRSAAVGAALAAGVGGKLLREKALEAYARGGDGNDAGDKLRGSAHALHAIIPAATGWLMYSHLKDDMEDMRGTGQRIFGRG